MVVARFFRSSPLGGVCALLLLALVSVAAMAERLAPYNPLTANYAHDLAAVKASGRMPALDMPEIAWR